MMPAGKYFVGDLCYVMHAEWDEFCKLTISGNDVQDGEFNLSDGRRFATFTTKYGDGSYQDQQGRSYPVDAGLIGCIRVEDVKEEIDQYSGQIVEFDKPFYCRSDDGVITFGNIVIDTGDDGINDEDEDEIY